MPGILKTWARRAAVTHFAELTYQDLVLKPATYELQRGTRVAPLTRKECALLEALMRRAGSVVPREVLIEEGWGMDSEVSDESSLCLVSRMFGNVTSSARVRPAAAVATRPIKDFLVESSAAPVATAIANTSNSTLQMPGNYILLDHGTDVGLQQGDVVELSDATLPRGQESWRAFGITVRSDRGLATVFLTGVSDQRVRLGDKAYVIRRAVAF